MMTKKPLLTDTFGVYVGRFNPIHLGHQVTLETMLHEHKENCMLILGSSNHELSIRHMFNLQERTQFIKKLYPSLTIVGLPDFDTDEEWLFALDQIMRLKYSGDKKHVVYFGGCEEETQFFANDGRVVHIVNRFDGTSPNISATAVRDALIHDRTLSGLVDTKIQDDLKTTFSKKRSLLQRK